MGASAGAESVALPTPSRKYRRWRAILAAGSGDSELAAVQARGGQWGACSRVGAGVQKRGGPAASQGEPGVVETTPEVRKGKPIETKAPACKERVVNGYGGAVG